MERYFIFLQYDGANYHGWQIQPNGKSIQEELMRSLSILLKTETEVIGAGRTDAGVNAGKMVAHFDVAEPIEPENGQRFEDWMVHKLNRMLPNDIVVEKLKKVKNDAHARFSAVSRTYQYHIVTGNTAFSRHYAYHFPHPLDFGLMNDAANKLFDYTDFTSFSKLHTDTKTNICHIMHAQWTREADLMYSPSNVEHWVFTIKADRFLRNMVRAIVGTLIDVGRGAISTDEFCKIIEEKNRCSAGTSVIGNALFLVDVEYPQDIFIE